MNIKKKKKDERVKDRSKVPVINNMKKVRIEAAQNTAQNNLTEGNF